MDRFVRQCVYARLFVADGHAVDDKGVPGGCRVTPPATTYECGLGPRDQGGALAGTGLPPNGLPPNADTKDTDWDPNTEGKRTQRPRVIGTY